MGKHDTKRDSETDIRKLMPDLATILKHADPAHSEQIYREAMDNPELDAAVAERDRQIAARDGRPSAPSRPEAPRGSDDSPVRVSAPSPWATGPAGHAIHKAVLPSADAPKAEPLPVTSPIPQRAARPRRRALPRWVLPGMGAVVLSPLTMWAVMSRLPSRQATNALMTSASAQATASVVVDAGAAPSSRRSAPAARSSTPPDTPPTATSVTPSAPPAPSSPLRHPGHPPQGAGDDPHGGPVLPAPTKTAEPAPSSSAATAPSAPSAIPSTPPADASSKLFTPTPPF
jgi:hypothetical protein